MFVFESVDASTQFFCDCPCASRGAISVRCSAVFLNFVGKPYLVLFAAGSYTGMPVANARQIENKY